MTPTLHNDLKTDDSGTFLSLTERERQVQAGLWAINFLVAELALGLLALRHKLVQKGLLTQKEDEALAETILNPDNLKKMYENVELAFAEKYQKVRFAAEHPEEVTRQVEEMRKATNV